MKLTADIVVTNATRDTYIRVNVADSLGATPQAGQTYYVSIDYTFNCPSTLVRNGYIDLGNVVTGGGTRTSLMGLQNTGTPIIATGVWGTTDAVLNSFWLQMPGWTGGGSVSGNIYVTVGFGECP